MEEIKLIPLTPDTVGKNTVAIKEYIAKQLKQDRESDQLSMFDPVDPFTGSKK